MERITIGFENKGLCIKCRHANQNTEDLEDGFVYCAFQQLIMDETATCTMSYRPEKSSNTIYFFYEPFDGNNCTWGEDTLEALLTES